MPKRMRYVVLLTGLMACLALTVSACGGGSSSSSSAEPSSSGESSETSETAGGGGEPAEEGEEANSALADVAAAKAMIKRSIEGPVYNVAKDDEATPEDFKTVTKWTGPTSAPKVEGQKTIEIVICLVGTACEEGGEAAAEAAEKLGWNAEVLDGKGTPAGFNEAMNTALAKNPDGIITVALPEGQISDKLETAKEDGIPVVSIASADEEKGLYGAYVIRQETETAMMEAWYAIAESGGKAKAVFLWDTSFVHLQNALERMEAIFEACAECKILQVYSRTLETATNPAAMQQLANSILQHYGGEVEYIFTPYGFGVAPVQAAVTAAGEDVQVLSKNAEQQNLQMVAAGEQGADFGSSVQWWGWASIDQMRRLMAGEEALEDSKEGLSMRTFTKEDTPSDGVVNWNKPVDFEAEYEKIWGVK